MAVFSKEQGITVVGVCAVYEVLVVQGVSADSVLALLPSSSRRQRGRTGGGDDGGKSRGRGRGGGAVLRVGVALATAAALLFLRFRVMGSTLPVFTNFDNPASYEAAPAKQVTVALQRSQPQESRRLFECFVTCRNSQIL